MIEVRPASPEMELRERIDDPTLVVNEIFGPTFQGEGPSIGRLAYFVRLTGCNLSCSWCDTAYTWAFSDGLAAGHRDRKRYEAGQEAHRMTWRAVLDKLEDLNPWKGTTPLLVLTGGEPMLQQDACVPLLRDLHDFLGWRIEVETAGTIAPHSSFVEQVDQFNVSLKLASSGNPYRARFKPEAIAALRAANSVWKFVVTGPSDLREVSELVGLLALRKEQVWIMPEGTTALQVQIKLREIADTVLAHGWNLTTRLHVQLWDNRRGV